MSGEIWDIELPTYSQTQSNSTCIVQPTTISTLQNSKKTTNNTCCVYICDFILLFFGIMIIIFTTRDLNTKLGENINETIHVVKEIATSKAIDYVNSTYDDCICNARDWEKFGNETYKIDVKVFCEKTTQSLQTHYNGNFVFRNDTNQTCLFPRTSNDVLYFISIDGLISELTQSWSYKDIYDAQHKSWRDLDTPSLKMSFTFGIIIIIVAVCVFLRLLCF